MVVVENGAAVVLSGYKWLEFLDSRAAGNSASPIKFGALVGDLIGDVTALLAEGSDPLLFPDRDPYDPIILTEGGRAIELTPDQWLAYLAASLAGGPCSVSDYGNDLGELSPAHELLHGPSARIMAAGVRAAMVANGDEVPAPLPCPIAEAPKVLAYG